MSLNPTSIGALKSSLGMVKTLRNLGNSAKSNNGLIATPEEIQRQFNDYKKNRAVIEDGLDDGVVAQDGPSAFEPVELPQEYKPKVKVVNIVNGVIQKEVVSEIKYVQINGKYYAERADNTYVINGEKIFVIDKKRYTLDEINGVPAQGRSMGEAMNDIKNVVDRKLSNSILPTSASSEDLLEQMAKTKDAIEKNRQQLNEITDGK